MDRVEYVLPLRLRGGALAVYRQLRQEQRTDPEECIQWMHSMDFTARRLRQNETVDEFLADLHRLTRLVGEPLPECWMTCAFASGLPQHIRQLLRASSRMETMTLEELLARARAFMTDNQGQIDPIVVVAQANRS